MADTYISALAAGEAWLHDTDSTLGRAMKLAGKPVELAMNQLPESTRTRVGETLTGAFDQILSGTEYTTNLDDVRRETEAAIAERGGDRNADIAARSAEVTTYARGTTAGAFASGFGTGLAGAAGLIADIPILIGLQARIGLQAATVWGYDPTDAGERILLLRLLEVAERFGEGRRDVVNEMLFASAAARSTEVSDKLGQLAASLTARGMAPAAVHNALQRTVTAQVSQFVAQRATNVATTVSVSTSVVGLLVDGGITEAMAKPLINSQSKRIGQWVAEKAAADYAEKLLARKLLAAVPVVGGVIGGSFNAWFTNRTATAAAEFYRIRYVCETYDGYDALGLTRPDLSAIEEAVADLDADDVAEVAEDGETTLADPTDTPRADA